MEFTTHLELQSQTTRLVDCRTFHSFGGRRKRGCHPPRRPFPGNFARPTVSNRHLQTTTPKIFSLSFSRFTRSY